MANENKNFEAQDKSYEHFMNKIYRKIMELREEKNRQKYDNQEEPQLSTNYKKKIFDKIYEIRKSKEDESKEVYSRAIYQSDIEKAPSLSDESEQKYYGEDLGRKLDEEYEPHLINPDSKLQEENENDISPQSSVGENSLEELLLEDQVLNRGNEEKGSIQVPKLLEEEKDTLDKDGKNFAISNPYRKGDDINIDYFEFLHCNYIGDKEMPPVLEEEKNFYLMLRALAADQSILVEGKARSGKSLLVDRLKTLLPDYVEISGASNNALLDMAEEINESKYVIFSEYQAVVNGNPRIKEAAKCISEDKDFTYNSQGKRKILNGDVTIIGTAADENKHTQSRDVEVSGRFIILKTDAGPEKTKRICDYQDGLDDGTIEDLVIPEDKIDKLKGHMQSVINTQVSYENPFAKAYSEYLPQTQKSTHYRTLYKSLMNGSAKFDSVNRVNKDNKLILNISDIYLIHQYYHETYCKTLKRLTGQSFSSLEKDPNMIRREENKEEFDYEINVIDEVMNKKVDWQKIWNHAYKHMQKHNPLYLDEWVKMQTRGDKVVVYDPLTKSDVYLCDAGDGNEHS